LGQVFVAFLNFCRLISQKYKQVSIEIGLGDAASLYHQNSTGKQTNQPSKQQLP
jgi:hypothetical protein